MIPSVGNCLQFMKKYKMLANIRAHSIMVEKVAGVIAGGLRDADVDISLQKTTAGALMHDIGKTPCLDSGGDHAAKGEEICLQNHLDEIAEIVREHVRLKSYEPGAAIFEKDIVYYADKRVNHDKVVSLEERLKYLLGHYGRNKKHLNELIKENFELCKLVEKKLFTKLSFGPEDLADMITTISP
jgi:putative nucleotidyltransferase with HDIG domain